MTALSLRQTLCAVVAALVAGSGLSAPLGAQQAPALSPAQQNPALAPAHQQIAPVSPLQPRTGVNAPTTPRTGGTSYRAGVALQRYVWEYPLPGFSEPDYRQGVEDLLAAYEQAGGKPLVPGSKGRVAIKLYTESGAGLTTPPALTKAVIAALQKRGFAPEQIYLVGLREDNLRSSGYLPPIGAEDQTPVFAGARVHALDSGEYYNNLWFYDSNLPSRQALAAAAQRREDLFNFQPDPEERKSYLNTLLFLESDFWINLPVAADNAALGVSGALANASLWNISNNERFFDSPANAPVAAAEISAIPELRETWALTILSLESYQYLGGPRFNAVYTGRERRLWMSANPVALDFLMWQRFKPLRARYGYPENTPEPPLFQYASSLGLGSYDINSLELRRLPAPEPTEQGGE